MAGVQPEDGNPVRLRGVPMTETTLMSWLNGNIQFLEGRAQREKQIEKTDR
ncbi:MAG: hypothetical protein ACREF6_00590 [Alphaproteobacteria bacterium]